MKRLRLVLGVALLLAGAGCLGLGPDPRAPHRLIIHNMETFAVEANVTVSQEGETLIARSLALGPGTSDEGLFGPADDGAYFVVVDRDTGGPALTNETMGRGGYALYVTFHGGGVQFSTLHGD